MLNFMALIPETLLSATLVLMLLTFWLRDKNTPKTFYTIAKWGVLAALIAEVVLYNQSLLRENYINNSQIMLCFTRRPKLEIGIKQTEKEGFEPSRRY